MKIPGAIRHLFTTVLALTAGLGALVLPGVAHAVTGSHQATRVAHTYQLPVPAPALHGVRAPSILSLPAMKPGAILSRTVPPDEALVGRKDPHNNPRSLPRNIVGLPSPSSPSRAPGTARPAAIAAAGVSSTFPGITQPGGLVPSDSSAAAGPSNVLEQVNGGVEVYNRSGGVVKGLSSLQAYYGVKSADIVYDVHTVFDPFHSRFIAMMQDNTTHSWVMSITSTSDATSSRCIYYIPALNSGATGIDFPLVATSPSYLMLTIRESGGGNANRLVVYPVIPMENCQSPGGWVWSNVKNPGDGSLADTLVPVLDYNPHDADSYLMNSYGNGGSNVSMYKFADTNPPGALIGTNVPVPAYTLAPPAAQKQQVGSNVFIETGNADITQAVNYNNGTYATLTTGSTPNVVPGILWMKFDPNKQTLLNDGLFYYTSGLESFEPSISEAANGSTIYTFSLSDASIYPSSVAVGMDVNNNLTLNQYIHQGAFPTPQSFNGSTPYTCDRLPCSRWGDFTTTNTDFAVNNNRFWSTSQDMANSSQWGTVIAYVSAT